MVWMRCGHCPPLSLCWTHSPSVEIHSGGDALCAHGAGNGVLTSSSSSLSRLVECHSSTHCCCEHTTLHSTACSICTTHSSLFRAAQPNSPLSLPLRLTPWLSLVGAISMPQRITAKSDITSLDIKNKNTTKQTRALLEHSTWDS